MKLDKRYWKALSAQFNEFAKDSWRRTAPRVIKVEQTGFFSAHVGHRGLNHDESTLLDFSTRLIEAREIFFAGGANEYGLHIYLNSTVHSRNAGTYIEMKRMYNGLPGKTFSGALYDHADEVPYFFKQCIPLHELFSEEYAEFVAEIKANPKDEDGEEIRTDDWALQHRFEKESARKVNDLFQHYSQNELQERLAKAGVKVSVFFRFTHEISAPRIPHGLGWCGKPEYVKLIKGGIEIGWIGSGTYNALPHVVRITRTREIKAVRLMDLGIESAGYYRHDQRCSIPKYQARKARAFFKSRFSGKVLKGAQK